MYPTNYRTSSFVGKQIQCSLPNICTCIVVGQRLLTCCGGSWGILFTFRGSYWKKEWQHHANFFTIFFPQKCKLSNTFMQYLWQIRRTFSKYGTGTDPHCPRSLRAVHHCSSSRRRTVIISSFTNGKSSGSCNNIGCLYIYGDWCWHTIVTQ